MRKNLLFLLFFGFFLLVPNTEIYAVEITKKSILDVNRDGIIESIERNACYDSYDGGVNPTGLAALCDVNQDEIVNIQDISAMSSYNANYTSVCQIADINNDKIVDVNDRNLVEAQIDTVDNSTTMLLDINGDGSIDANDLSVLDSVIGCIWLNSTLNVNSVYTSSTPELTGLASSINLGTSGKISSVSYSVDSGSWITTGVSASDGLFNSYSESYKIIFSTLAEGSHTLRVKAGTNRGDTSYINTYNFTIDSYDPTNPEFSSLSNATNDSSYSTFTFKKSTDTTSQIASYSLILDEGKNQSYSVTDIPKQGNGQDNYVWKDDTDVKIIFQNEQDSDPLNDLISVTFKKVSVNQLAEGIHVLKVIAYDTAGNSKENSQNIKIDKTAPFLSGVSIANISLVSNNQTYQINSNQLLLSFAGTINEEFKGSEIVLSNGTKDTFEKTASGISQIKLIITKENLSSQYSDYLSVTSSSLVTKDLSDKQVSDFYLTASKVLEKGKYRINLLAKDNAGNEGGLIFYLEVGLKKTEYLRPSPTPEVFKPVDKKIAEIQTIPTISPVTSSNVTGSFFFEVGKNILSFFQKLINYLVGQLN